MSPTAIATELHLPVQEMIIRQDKHTNSVTFSVHEDSVLYVHMQIFATTKQM